jgi:formylmethanofuran dehydrogenase subunit B
MHTDINDGQLAGAEVRTCPFCGLLCDDITVQASAAGAVTASGRACELGRAGFARQTSPGPDTPLIGGEPISLDRAVAAACRYCTAPASR